VYSQKKNIFLNPIDDKHASENTNLSNQASKEEASLPETEEKTEEEEEKSLKPTQVAGYRMVEEKEEENTKENKIEEAVKIRPGENLKTNEKKTVENEDEKEDEKAETEEEEESEEEEEKEETDSEEAKEEEQDKPTAKENLTNNKEAIKENEPAKESKIVEKPAESRKASTELSTESSVSKVSKLAKTEKTESKATNASKVSKVTPIQSTFDESLDLAYANGSYTPPSKMWYYNRHLDDVPTVITTSFDFVPVLKVDFRLPREMKELVINFVIPGINVVANNPTGNYPGFEVALHYDNISLDSSVFTINEVQGRSVTRTVVLEGTIYNASAGNHSAHIKLRITNGNIVNFFLQEIITKQNMKINVNMVGYVGSPEQYSTK